MEKIYHIILKFRWLVIVTVIVLTGFFSYQMKNMKMNSDIISSLPDDDPDAVLFKKIGESFGGNNMGMIILETDNIFKPEIIEHVALITDTLKMIEGISSVTSLTNIINIKGDENGLEIGKLVDEFNPPLTEEDFIRLKERIFSKELYKGSIVSEDETATLIVFTLTEEANIQAVAKSVIDKTQSLRLPEQLYYIGSPMLVTYISDMMFGDLVLLLPIAFVLIAVVLYISFRSVIGVVLPMLNAVVAVIWTLGIIALCGYEMSMISNNIPIILLAVGSAYTIHVVNRINRYKRKDSKRTIVLVMMFIFIPVTLAALTTMIGFLSFIYGSYLEMIRFFGIFTALGTFLAAVFSLFVVPAVISTITIKNSKFAGNVEEQKFSIMTRHFLVPLKNLLHRHPKYTLTVWGILIVVSLGGIFMIKRSVDIRDYFKKDNPTRTAEDIMTKKFGGSKPVFVHFKGDMQSPEVLKTMLNAEAYMKQSPDIVTTQSVAGLIAEINGVMGEGYGIPETRDKIEQMWFLLEGNEIMPRFVSEGLDEGIIVSKFVSPDNKAKKEFARFINKFIVENSTEECQISITGMPFVDITMDESLVKSQFGSLTLAIIFVVIVVGAIFRSIKTGFYAMLPIIASIIILFGFMGYAGISLNIATVLVASVAMGIGIDYSIHVISHFNHAFKRKNNLSFALDETIMVSGKAIVINVVSVTAGFLVLLFSEMVPLQYFGLLIAMSMIGSSLGALTLLPVILILVNKKHAHKKI